MLKILCFLFIGASFFVTALVYRTEAKKTGGLGIATFLLVSFIIYSLLNPLAYLINPQYAVKYAEYLGEIGTKQIFPGILAATLFIFFFSFIFISLLKEFNPSTYKIEPIPEPTIKKMILVASLLLFSGIVMFFWRNQTYFGSLLGSINAPYSGGDARPVAGFASNYASLLEWSIIIYSIAIFWQVAAKKWNNLLAVIPITIGIIFAILEGNRVLAGTALFIWIGWYFLRSKITLKIIIFALFALTAMTLLANSRYERGTESIAARALLIFNPKDFRPFWVGDPTGPSVVLTYEADHSSTIKNISLGLGYIRSVQAMVPSFIWPDRPNNPGVDFYQRFQGEGRGGYYAPGAGYAYSMIAESMANFWYFGPIMLGIFWGLIVIKFIRWYSSANEGINRAVCALGVYFLVWFVVRDYFAVYFNPITLIGILISWYTLHKISPDVVSWPFVRLDPSAKIGDSDESES